MSTDNFSSEFAKVHGPNWLKWLSQLVGKPHVSGLELGTWRGDSAAWALENVFTHHHSRYVCVDTFEGSEEHHLAGVDCSGNEAAARALLAPFGERVLIHKARSDEFLRGRIAQFDFIYVDAAHDAMNVLRDSVLAFDLLRTGGLIAWDDYEWEVMEREIDRPKMAIDAFLACFAGRLEVVSIGWQVIARRVA